MTSQCHSISVKSFKASLLSFFRTKPSQFLLRESGRDFLKQNVARNGKKSDSSAQENFLIGLNIIYYADAFREGSDDQHLPGLPAGCHQVCC